MLAGRAQSTGVQGGHPLLSWSLAIIGLALFVAFGVVFFSPITPPALNSATGGAITALWLFPFLGFLPVGLLLTLRRPGSPIGWLALAAILILGAGSLAELVGSILLIHHNGLSGVVLLLSVLWTAPGGGPALLLLMVMLLIFPDGHLPSRGWRWLLYTA